MFVFKIHMQIHNTNNDQLWLDSLLFCLWSNEWVVWNEAECGSCGSDLTHTHTFGTESRLSARLHGKREKRPCFFPSSCANCCTEFLLCKSTWCHTSCYTHNLSQLLLQMLLTSYRFNCYIRKCLKMYIKISILDTPVLTSLSLVCSEMQMK